MRHPPFSEGARRKVGKLQRVAMVIAGIVEVGKMIAQAVRDRKNPKRATEILDGELEVERIRREAGRSMVGNGDE